ncbi:type 1 glutamine amidotransferase domain-containing protein [Saccharothrix lopnurensis]|uniref:Type 1 glutamine amidotransferase domain-containing protein n=1 Tax=Saccharothrix lopnurensis TaxID=1670621 RepID=A0ABW1P1U6_9PSEU
MAEQKRIAFLVDTEGIEQVELTDPWQHVEKAGAVPRLLAPKLGTVRGFHHLTPADEFDVDVPYAHADPNDYDGVVIPGGVANADFLRMDRDAVRFVEQHVAAGKPVASICHGPWLLVEAGVVRGKALTSFPSLATDIRNAGGDWADEEVRVCTANGWTLVTSRNPDDLPAFNREALKAFGLRGL